MTGKTQTQLSVLCTHTVEGKAILITEDSTRLSSSLHQAAAVKSPWPTNKLIETAFFQLP